MDFHSLTRRELQALCKKNKIPANITNVAMAEALGALEIVEGIEELMQPSQSGTAQSSIESLEMPVEISPFVPPAAGRRTCCINIAKEVSESVNPTTRTRRTTRKTQFKDADAMETPALMAQTNRKKGQVASARRNMDSQLKECVDDDKMDFLVTPAPMVGTSRRRRVEESAVKNVYSTRRSVRLAEKNNVEIANEVEIEESQLFKKEMVAKDGDNEDMNLTAGVDDFNELSEITAVEGRSEDKDEPEAVSIGKDEFEVVSGQKQDTSVGRDESVVVEDEVEVVSDQKQDTSIREEIKMGSYAEEDEYTNFETESKLEEEKCDNEEDNMPLNVSNEVQQNDGSQDVYIPKIGITIEKSTDGLKTEKGEASQDEAADFVEDILGNGENFVVDESSCRNAGFHEEIKEELNENYGVSKYVADLNVTLVKLTELTLQQAAQEADSDFIDHSDIPVQLNENELNEIEALQLEESEKAADQVETDEPCADFSDQIPNSGVDVETSHPSGFDGLENDPKENEPTEIEIILLQESEKAADPELYADFSEQVEDVEISHPSGFEGLENEPNENKPNETENFQLEESEKAADQSDESYVDFSEQIPTSGVDVEIGHSSGFEGLDSRKSSASKASVATKRMTGFLDNKENIGSGGKLVIMRDVKMAKKSVENVNNLNELSMRKLSKMLKEKLEITKKSSKNENGNETMSRPALQVLPENRLVDETQN